MQKQRVIYISQNIIFVHKSEKLRRNSNKGNIIKYTGFLKAFQLEEFSLGDIVEIINSWNMQL